MPNQTFDKSLFPLFLVLALRKDLAAAYRANDYTALTDLGFSQSDLDQFKAPIQAVAGIFPNVTQAVTRLQQVAGYTQDNCPTDAETRAILGALRT
jgi:hypothetical protein